MSHNLCELLARCGLLPPCGSQRRWLVASSRIFATRGFHLPHRQPSTVLECPSPDTNRILYNYDCLEVLNDEVALPSRSVDLIYADPPFNSESRYNLPFTGKDRDTRPVEAFNDTWSWGAKEDQTLLDLSVGPETRRLADIVKLAQTIDQSRSLAAYLVNMAARLIPMRRVLTPKGSIYLHCDDTASHYLKLLMDVIFGRESFRNEVIWKRNSSHNDGKWRWGRVTDTVLFYSRSPLNKDAVRVPLDKDYVKKTYRYKDERGIFSVGDLTAKGLTGGGYFYDFHGHLGPWRFPEERMWDLERDGLVYLPNKRKGVPRFKRYLDSNKGQVPPNIWADIPKLESASPERLGYPTQKPLALATAHHRRLLSARWPCSGPILWLRDRRPRRRGARALLGRHRHIHLRRRANAGTHPSQL